MLSGFTFSKVVIIESLGVEEARPAQFFFEFIKSLIEESDHGVGVEVKACSGVEQFLDQLKVLEVEAASGVYPLLHIECHGSPLDGLVFEDGGWLEWDRVAEALRPINRAANFNLLAVFSACFGSYFIGHMNVINPAPCWCVIAPTRQVDGPEIFEGFREFYSALFESGDMGEAVRAISKCALKEGRWLWEPAEIWFERLIENYIEGHCTRAASRQRARELIRGLKKNGVRRGGVSSLLRIMRKQNRELILKKYFDRYFMLGEIPENFSRFSAVRDRVGDNIDRLGASGRYLL